MFVDQGYFPERRSDGIARDPGGGDGAASVVLRAANYGAPVCSHFGANIYRRERGKACEAYGGCTLCNPGQIKYIDSADPEDNVEQRLAGPLAERARGILRPEVEKHGDGIVCITLFIPESPVVAETAAPGSPSPTS